MDTARPEASALHQSFSDERCRQLLNATRICRIAFVDDGLPQLVVLNHLTDGLDVLVRTSAESRLAGLTSRGRGIPVALEVDSASSAGREGWSVIASGTLTRDPRDQAHERLPEPWRQGTLDVVLRLSPQHISGVQVQAGQD